MIILMDAIEELSQLSHSMRQAAGLLADEDIDETSSSASSKCSSTFLNIVALGNTVSWLITALLNAVSVLIYDFRIEWLHFYISGLSGFWIRNFNLIIFNWNWNCIFCLIFGKKMLFCIGLWMPKWIMNFWIGRSLIVGV